MTEIFVYFPAGGHPRPRPSTVSTRWDTATGLRAQVGPILCGVDFGLEAREEAGRAILGVSGDLDALTAPQLRDRLIETIEAGRRQLLVDLTRCEFIDSSGLSALVSGFKRVRAMGGDLGLICPQGPVRRLIEMVALDRVFNLYDDETEVG